MKQLGISNQIILISIAPALIIAVVLSTYFIINQFSYISDTLDINGSLIAKQLSPSAEYAVYSGNTKIIKSAIDTIIKNNPVLRIQVLDKYKNSIIDITNDVETTGISNSFFASFIGEKKQRTYSEPILSAELPLAADSDAIRNTEKIGENETIGTVIVTLTTAFATKEKVQQIKFGLLITFGIVLLALLIIHRLSLRVTYPIKTLTKTVRDIS